MTECPHQRHAAKNLSRRDFLHVMGVTAAGMVAAGCQPQNALSPSAQPTAAQSIEAAASVTASPATAVPPTVAAGSTATAATTAAAPTATKATVAIAKANSYDPVLIKQQVQAALDGIGGIADVLAHGTKVAIKINLTGGVTSDPLHGILEIESYLTHPEVVKALIELLRDAGAKDIYIVEAAYEPESWTKYGFDAVAKATGATIVDLTNMAPYKDFATQARPGTPFIYDKFTFNHILEEVDAFISVPKMKCHNVCGITNSMKNLVGLVPFRLYNLAPTDKYRSAFHGDQNGMKYRLPRVVNDLNQTRPVNLALIDGVWTCEGGEGPWITGQVRQVKSNIILAGKDPVATDAVAVACMGFDPAAEYPHVPFLNAENHLNIAAKLGYGTNHLDEIKVVGAAINDVKKQFAPSYQS